LTFYFIQAIPVHLKKKPGSTTIIAQDSGFQNDSILNNIEEFRFYTTDNPHCDHYKYKSLGGV
jgi:hypothetical protein